MKEFSFLTQPVLWFCGVGFTEAKRACCGTGTVEMSLVLCNPMSIGTCLNAQTHVFWDASHPSEAANKVIVDSMLPEVKNMVA